MAQVKFIGEGADKETSAFCIIFYPGKAVEITTERVLAKLRDDANFTVEEPEPEAPPQ